MTRHLLRPKLVPMELLKTDLRNLKVLSRVKYEALAAVTMGISLT
jgi:hypothetical protein